MAFALRLVESVAGGEHDGLAVVLKLLEKPLLEAVGAVDRKRRHQIERAARAFADDAGDLLQSREHGVAAAAVFLADGVKIVRLHAVERGGSHLIERGDGQPRLTVFERLRHKLAVAADQAADARAAGGKTLGNGIGDDQIFLASCELGKRAERLVAVDEFAVDLVCDQEQVMLLCKVQQQLHLRVRQDGAGGVAGICDQNGARAGRERGLELFAGGVEKALLGARRNGVDGCAGGADECAVIRIKRFCENDLVTFVEDAVERDLKRLTAAGRDEDVLRGDVHADAVIVLADGIDRLRHAGRRRIGQRPLMEGTDGVKERGRRGDIRLADVQVIDLFARCSGSEGVWVEFAHGGKLAAKCLAGKLHGEASLQYFPARAGRGAESGTLYRLYHSTGQKGIETVSFAASFFCKLHKKLWKSAQLFGILFLR